ncbi:hypothetical protein FHW36_108222 [Chitinophaga polysaccharea]|uniref:HTH cro/C1-type domain-containing protein n=1 Tax=Chitinophaga polysaccharea TaxID=1293035 RepID=A0A561PCS8_9BACT|nr:helix-turn-helix transcriptional regulator [Chitinophaga polysaccharea]TWF35866.1 hypothetical protein FHW36_108222 [Chitinophaga polysaccharea]
MNELRKKLNELTAGDDGKESVEFFARVAFREANKDWLVKSGDIIMTVIAVMSKLKLTPADMAKRMNISEEEMYKILRGDENMTLQTIVRMEKVFGIDLIKVVKSSVAVKAVERKHFQLS